MSEVGEAIIDAAERRIRDGGFHGFSFREIAADVGVKSSTVHYYFPTKEDLGAAVVRRYTEKVAGHMDKYHETEPDPVKVWTKAFRGTLKEHGMCPCTVLAAGSLDLPKAVAVEVKRFFQMCLDKQMEAGLSAAQADELLALIMGALVVSNAFGGDLTAYDRAVAEFMRRSHGVEQPVRRRAVRSAVKPRARASR
jgi:TetR/AcrR family transcriptional regulator, transcriptional repressor for nem operon